MSKSTRFFIAAAIGGGVLAGGYGVWVASDPAVPAKVKAGPAEVKTGDDAVVLEVLEGMFGPNGGRRAGTLRTPKEEFEQMVKEVANRRGMKVNDLQNKVAEWARRVEALDAPDAYQLALALYQSGDYKKAAASALTAYQKALQQHDGGRTLAQRAALVRAQSLMALQQYADADTAFANAIALTDPKTETLAWIQAQEARAYALFQQNRFPEMAETLQKAVDARKAVPMFSDEGVCYSLTFLAEAYRRQLLLPEAQVTLQDALDRMGKFSKVSPTVKFEALCTLEQIVSDMGRPAEGIPYLEQALAISQSTGRIAGIDPGRASFQMGNIYKKLGQETEAVPWYRQSADYYRSAAPGLERRECLTLSSLATSLAMLGQFDEAETDAKESVSVMQTAQEGFEYDLPAAKGALGFVYMMEKNFTAAEPTLREAIQMTEAKYGPDAPKLAGLLGYLGFVLWQQQRLDEAEPLFWDAVGMDFRASVVTNVVAPGLPMHLRQFLELMRQHGVSDAEMKTRVQQLGTEAKMTVAQFNAAVGTLKAK